MGGQEYKCQSWKAISPHRSMYLTNEKHNYCRNPTNDYHGPWCYILGHNTKTKASCNIPSCSDDKRNSCGKFWMFKPAQILFEYF